MTAAALVSIATAVAVVLATTQSPRSPAPRPAAIQSAARSSGREHPVARPAPASRAAALAAPAAKPDAGIEFPLHTSGPQIVDAHGHPVKLRFVNWYGAESPDYVVGGLKYAPIATIISEIVAAGFNGVRLPWSNQLWQANPVVSGHLVTANPQFAGEHAGTILAQVVRDLANAGLMIILDNHNSTAEWCCSDSDSNELWYVPGSATYTTSSWEADWTSVASTFKSVPQVIGVDLRNEPRGSAVWGGGSASDWHAAAQAGGDAVQGADPNLLIFVEGINYATDLAGVGALPARLDIPDHVVYEAHDYGFDTTVTGYDQWVGKIQPAWGYLVGKVPLWLGEFGTCTTSATCLSGGTSADLGRWFAVFTRYARYHNLSWSYWALNGTKSDGASGQDITYGQPETYGVLNTAWNAAASGALLSALKAIEPACGAGALANGTYYIRNRASGDMLDVPAFKKTQGTDLDQWPRTGGANQRWRVIRLSCNLYQVTSALDGQSVDIAGQSASPGAKVDQYYYWGGGNQQFLLAKNSAGYYTIEAINSLDPITVPNSTAGALPTQQAASTSTAQQWSFVSA